MLLYDSLLEENRETIEQRETNSFYKNDTTSLNSESDFSHEQFSMGWLYSPLKYYLEY